MNPVTAIVEYDDSYSDEELDELEQQLRLAGVSAQIQPLGARAGFGEVAVWLSVLLGEVTAQILVEHAMKMLWQTILTAVRGHRRRLAASGELNQSYQNDVPVSFEFNGLRVSVRGDDIDDVKVHDLLLASSQLVEIDSARVRSWVWDAASAELRPQTPDEE